MTSIRPLRCTACRHCTLTLTPSSPTGKKNLTWLVTFSLSQVSAFEPFPSPHKSTLSSRCQASSLKTVPPFGVPLFFTDFLVNHRCDWGQVALENLESLQSRTECHAPSYGATVRGLPVRECATGFSHFLRPSAAPFRFDALLCHGQLFLHTKHIVKPRYRCFSALIRPLNFL